MGRESEERLVPFQGYMTFLHSLHVEAHGGDGARLESELAQPVPGLHEGEEPTQW